MAKVSISPQTTKDLRGNMLFFSLIDNGLGDSDGVFYTIHVEIGAHVVVEEVTSFVIREAFDVIAKPLRECFIL